MSALDVALKSAAKLIIKEYAQIDYFDIVTVNHTNVLEKLKKHSDIYDKTGRKYFALCNNAKVATSVEILSCSEGYGGEGLIEFGTLNDLVTFLTWENDDMETSGQYEQRKKIRERLATRSLRFRDCLNRFDSRDDNCLEDTQFTITGEFDRTSRDHLIDTIHRMGGVVADRVRNSDFLIVGLFPGEKKLQVAKKNEVEVIDLEQFIKMID